MPVRADEGSGEAATGSARNEGVPILLGLVLAALMLHLSSTQPSTNFEELALGRETTSLYAEIDGVPIHCGGVDNAHDCLEGHAARNPAPLLVWLGNSQLHAVNQLRAGESTAPLVLHEALAARGFDVLAFSQPNASLQEHFVLFAYLSLQAEIRALILPLVFDDFRETGIRAEIAGALDDPQVVPILDRHEIGRSIIANNRRLAAGDLAALSETVQEQSEVAIDSWLEEHSALWAARPQTRGQIVTNLLKLRNYAMGIDAQSKRGMIPGRLAQNLAATAALLSEAERQGIPTLCYVVPLRDDVEPPYVASEYDAWKRDVALLAEGHGARFVNLEALVPAEQWGQGAATRAGGDAEIDFMHFQAAGHSLLAAAVLEALHPLLGNDR